MVSQHNTLALHTRPHDVTLVLVQRNDLKQVQVSDVLGTPESILQMTGFSRNELLGKDFIDLLPARLAENLVDYVEYEQGGSDIADVMRRVRDMAFLHRLGNMIPLSMRVVTGVALGEHVQVLLVLGMQESMSDEVMKSIMLIKAEEQLDALSGITDYQSFVAQCELVEHHITHGHFSASLLLVHLDAPQQLDTESLPVLSLIIKRCLRGSDLLTYLGDGFFAAILLKASTEQARIPMQRMREHVQIEMGYTLSQVVRLASGGRSILSLFDDARSRLNVLAERGAMIVL
jgi:GGDEF domain-containing protein